MGALPACRNRHPLWLSEDEGLSTEVESPGRTGGKGALASKIRSDQIRGCVVGYVLGERDVLKFQADCAEEGLSVARWQPFSGHPGITYLIQGRRALLLCGQRKACVFPQKCQWGAPYPTLGVGRPGMEYQLA